MKTHLSLSLLVLACVLPSATAFAQWVPDGDSLCTAAGNQIAPAIATDGSGGAVVAWQDYRSGTSDIYAQRIDASGLVRWTMDGVAICTATSFQYTPQVASDGAGGAIVTWFDIRSGRYDVYAQRVNASGVVRWTTDGIPVCNAVNDQINQVIVSDGSGGAIIAWQDSRNDIDDVYAQRIDSTGAALWTPNGVVISATGGSQQNPTIVSDGSHGAIITWADSRGGDFDIYAQRIDGSGAVQWTADGVALCAAQRAQSFPTITGDGSGGAIVTWYDGRTHVDNDIYAQRVDATGSVQWSSNGVALCTAAGDQDYPMIASDGSGGAIVTWYDKRSGNFDIYAQRVDGLGTVQWAVNGVALCSAANDQNNPTIVEDGSGGAIVTWQDYRTGSVSDIYAQRVDASGAVQWGANGIGICTATSFQYTPVLVSNGGGGAIITWEDYRNGPDIYAQRVAAGGLTAVGVTPRTPSTVLTSGYPNPFSARTTIEFTLPTDAVVKAEVFDAVGHRVRTIDLGRMTAGKARLDFDGRNDAGQVLASGVYFYRVRASGWTTTRRLVLTR